MIATLDIITIDEIEYLTELKNSAYQITVERMDGKKVIWSTYKSHLEKTGSENITDESLFKFDIDLIWKLLSDKNLVLIESKKDYISHMYVYSTSNSSRSSSILSTESISYKITDFGELFIDWVLS
jgi:hypothetical protein